MSENLVPNIFESLATDYSVPSGEVILGEFVQLGSMGEPIVKFVFNSCSKSFPAISTVSLNQRQIGRKVALVFVGGDVSKPIIIGLVHSALQEMIENFELTSAADIDTKVDADVNNTLISKETDMRVDGKKVVLEAEDKVVLKCGDASITLNKSGKISIRGKYILNRSTGVNRILGGSVQIN